MTASNEKKLGLIQLTALGVGIIIGASIFSLIGVGAQIAKHNLPEAFALSSLFAFTVAYSYAKLGTIYVSNAGPIEYVMRAFGDNVFVGFLAFIYWFSFVISISLFANSFAGYFLGFLGLVNNTLLFYIVEILVVIAFVLLNFKGSKAVGDAETLLVAIKLGILGIFVIGGAMFIKPQNLTPDFSAAGIYGMIVAASMYLLSYAGFGTITNASENAENPRRTVPLAIYLSLLIATIVYVSVSIVAIGAVPLKDLIKAKEYALAEAAKPFLGEFGFTLITIGALISISSALNSALYGGANVAYALAKKGELPRIFDRRVWFSEPEGLYITAGLGMFLAVFLNLSGIAEVTTISFLTIYLAVAIAHWKLKHITKGNPTIIILSVIFIVFAGGMIMYYSFHQNPRAFYTTLVALIGFFLFELTYRGVTRREMKIRNVWYEIRGEAPPEDLVSKKQ
ncbi:hypothetical protein IPA_00370 [Ignicoccus pacificus DSM 13166]|uniref:Amino acid permease n=1 Tax=Ignicoccus pacificus DSM 13166 TaxID=940294 RepID=A0A977K8V2_9CREN|nr:hypothetical protein IPA_00370 [Ignicoccus pacificus DSM 13166]